MGGGWIWLKTAAATQPELSRQPKWRKLFLEDPRVPQGELLMSFQLIPKEDVQKYPLQKIKPETRDCIFEISALGVRDLQPYLTFGKGDIFNFIWGGEKKKWQLSKF